MSLEQLIADYGYLAIFVGTFLEGETIVILAGVAAQLGYLELPWVIARRLSWQQSAEKVYKHLRRHQYWLILTFRFYYGLRNVTPFAVGAAYIPRGRFFVLNLIGAGVWAAAFGYAGYLYQ